MTSVNQEPTEEEIMATPDASADLLANSLGDYLRIVGRRIRSGESGALLSDRRTHGSPILECGSAVALAGRGLRASRPAGRALTAGESLDHGPCGPCAGIAWCRYRKDASTATPWSAAIMG